MNLEATIQSVVAQSVKTLYNIDIETSQIQIQKTKKEFEGDITVVVFPFAKAARKSPEGAGAEIGEFIVANNTMVSKFNVIKGFLNLSITIQHDVNTIQYKPSDTVQYNTNTGQLQLQLQRQLQLQLQRQLHRQLHRQLQLPLS